jgi:pyridoxamine 5'-phosphate oxidase
MSIASVPVLDVSTVDKNPFRQFEKWYGEAFALLGEDASAMALCTSNKGIPNARTVYLRGSDKKGFWFFTNYRSQKGKELIENPNACLLFFWPRLFRQVKIMGRVEKLSEKISDRYFRSRPRGSQIGAWASPQSEVLLSRETLDSWVAEYSKLFEGKEVPRPKHWGGFRLVPIYFEFWYGREYRLHDRIAFSRQKNRKWKIERLAP